MYSSPKADAALKYWKLSKAWRGNAGTDIDEEDKGLTIEGIIQRTTNLGGKANHLGYHKLEAVVATLINAIVMNKRCRKTKPVNNLVQLPLKPATKSTTSTVAVG